jgi:hypothetical protein
MKRIEAVRRKYEGQLMQLPNVNGVGLGEKDGKEVIVVFVTRKLPESELQPNEVIPKRIQGYDIDVQEAGVLVA